MADRVRPCLVGTVWVRAVRRLCPVACVAARDDELRRPLHTKEGVSKQENGGLAGHRATNAAQLHVLIQTRCSRWDLTISCCFDGSPGDSILESIRVAALGPASTPNATVPNHDPDHTRIISSPFPTCCGFQIRASDGGGNSANLLRSIERRAARTRTTLRLGTGAWRVYKQAGGR